MCGNCSVVYHIHMSLSFSADVSITFDPSTYTVSEGNTVQVFLMADKDYSEPFNVTVNSVNTEGEVVR